MNYLKYMAFVPNPPHKFSLDDVKFTDAEFRKLNLLADAIYNANRPDLRAFASHGGKLILYHGWADQAIPPWSTLDYYAAMERAMGRLPVQPGLLPAVQIPGAYHCLSSPDGSINIADFLTPLISWARTAPALALCPPTPIPRGRSRRRKRCGRTTLSPRLSRPEGA